MFSEISKAEEAGQTARNNGQTGVPPKQYSPQEKKDFENGFNGKKS